MKINIERVMRDLKNLSKFNETPEEGCTRYSYTKEDKEARDYLINEMKALGMKVEVDPIGNIRGRLENEHNKDKPLVISGSHIDTVYKGGIYDGILGLVASLESARVFVEKGTKMSYPYEVVIFTEEEGSNFGYNLVGSKALVGKCTLEDIKKVKDKNNKSMYERVKEFGYPIDSLEKCSIREDIKAFIELHIEQGSVLHTEKKSLGLVKGIVGLRWFEIEIEGKANHAGATPMNLRRDAMVKASELISKLPHIVEDIDDDSMVVTVGSVKCYPGNVNVIPEKVVFTVDLRGINPLNLDKSEEEIKERLKFIEEEGFAYSIKRLTEVSEVNMDKNLMEVIKNSIEEEDISYREMYSGANHDTSLMASISPVAMIFVPSVEGRSHCPEEFTEEEDIAFGVEILYKTLHKLITE